SGGLCTELMIEVGFYPGEAGGLRIPNGDHYAACYEIERRDGVDTFTPREGGGPAHMDRLFQAHAHGGALVLDMQARLPADQRKNGFWTRFDTKSIVEHQCDVLDAARRCGWWVFNINAGLATADVNTLDELRTHFPGAGRLYSHRKRNPNVCLEPHP